MARTRFGRVYAVELTPPKQPGLFGSPASELVRLLTPGQRTTRYKRQWIIGRTHRDGDALTGRIGFVAEGGITEVWDEDAKDFRDEDVYRGLTTTFAIDLKTLTGLIQDRKPDITIDAAIGAMLEILNEGRKEKPLLWDIESRTGTRNLQQWIEQVDKVTSVRLTVRQPNPHWQDAKSLQDLMDQATAEVARIELESDQGIDLDSPFLADTQNHIDRGYGDGIYTGVVTDDDGNERRSVFNTRVGVEELNEELPTNEAGEVDEQVLRSRLAIGPPTEDTEVDERDTDS